jgi:hypothetical protein
MFSHNQVQRVHRTSAETAWETSIYARADSNGAASRARKPWLRDWDLGHFQGSTVRPTAPAGYCGPFSETTTHHPPDPCVVVS